MTSFQGLKGLFGSKKSHDRHNDRHIAEIGMPTNVVHDIHVGKNAHGELEGTCKITKLQVYNARLLTTEKINCIFFRFHSNDFRIRFTKSMAPNNEFTNHPG